MLKNADHGGRITLPNCPNFVSGVAVLATDTWAALEGARKLKVEWQYPENGDDSDLLMDKFEAALDGDAEIVRQDGDPIEENPTIDVVYKVPFLAHVPMEPMNCTARVVGDQAEVWAPTQNPPMAAEAVAKVLGISQENVTIHVMRSGGAFGRRFYADFITDTVLLAKWSGRPVKVVWPREDDVRHDYFRPANLQRIRAALNNGHISHWHQRVVSHPREIYLERDGSAAEISNYEFPAAFVPNLRFDYLPVPARIPLGQWRAVDHSGNVFVVSSAIDELAVSAGTDPVEFWLKLVGNEEFVQVREDFNFNASRLRRVIETVADKSGWDSPVGEGRGRGIAASYNQGAWVAEVAEVTVTNGTLKIDRITCVIDCGRLINPRGAVKQVEGGILEGISAALYGKINVRNGIVQESNFHDYRLCRMHETPEIDVHFMPWRGAVTASGAGDHQRNFCCNRQARSGTANQAWLNASGALNLARDVDLLCQRQSGIGCPIEHQPGREESEQHRKNHRHRTHHFTLYRIHAHHRREALCGNHEDRVEGRQYEIRIAGGQVFNPQNERRLAQLNGLDQHPVERNEYGNLDQNWQAAAKRIHLFGLVQLHHRLAHALAIITIAFFELFNPRLQFSHPGGGTKLCFGQF
jgi:hypothetical protein